LENKTRGIALVITPDKALNEAHLPITTSKEINNTATNIGQFFMVAGNNYWKVLVILIN
jgi:hypothetical protein